MLVRTTSTYGDGLRTTLRSTAAAYGYTLSIATTISVLTSVEGAPDSGRLFLFVFGGTGAFVLLEGLLRLLRPGGDEPSGAFPLAGALNVVAVAGALGSSTGVAHAVHSALAWLLAPMAATAAYMLLVALQVLVVVRRGER